MATVKSKQLQMITTRTAERATGNGKRKGAANHEYPSGYTQERGKSHPRTPPRTTKNRGYFGQSATWGSSKAVQRESNSALPALTEIHAKMSRNDTPAAPNKETRDVQKQATAFMEKMITALHRRGTHAQKQHHHATACKQNHCWSGWRSGHCETRAFQ